MEMRKKYVKIAEDYNSNPEKYLKHFFLVINGKRREITTYARNEKGLALRQVHSYVSDFIHGLYKQSTVSFAYVRKKNIIDCINVHIESNHFLKTDIHSFFDSIVYEKLFCLLMKHSRFKRAKNVQLLIKACFYKGRIPVGFVSSPVLSDIYLFDVDEKYKQKEGILYTRYADDFIISVEGDKVNLSDVCDELREDLQKQGLYLNSKKTYTRVLKEEGDAIHLLGINLVKTQSCKNRITVSDSYIRKTCKNLSQLLSFSGVEEEKRELCDIVCGQISFVKMCSADSFKKLSRMAQIKCNYFGGLDTKSLYGVCGYNK